MDVDILTPDNIQPPVSLSQYLGDDRTVVIFHPSFLGPIEEISKTVENLADFFYEIKFILVYDPDEELMKRYGAEILRVVLFRKREVCMRLRSVSSHRQVARCTGMWVV